MVTRWAVIEGGVVTNVVLWDGDVTTWTKPDGASVTPFDAKVHTVYAAPETQAQVNERTVRDRAEQALKANATYLALPSPTAAQTVAQVGRVTRECSAVIRLLLGLLDDVTDTA